MSLRQNDNPVDYENKRFSYQSECHCAKTPLMAMYENYGLVTSQNVTAPKLNSLREAINSGLVTSQNVTAPKL